MRYAFSLFCFFGSLSAFVYYPFDRAMRVSADLRYVDDDKMHAYVGMDGRQVYDFFKHMYEADQAAVQREKRRTIPKIIHQIWIGKTFPHEFSLFQESCKCLHPDWEYKLWTLDDLATLTLSNKEFIKQSKNPGEISDLLRYEILYQFGGVYLDCDIECLTALDELHEYYDLYVGLQPLDTGYVQLGIGVIGACPGHPMIKAAIDGVAQNWHNRLYRHMATVRTGPLYFTKIFINNHSSDQRNIALPSFYFYPLGSIAFEIDRATWQKMGVYTVHHWAKSWLLPAFRKDQFKSIHNY